MDGVLQRNESHQSKKIQSCQENGEVKKKAFGVSGKEVQEVIFQLLLEVYERILQRFTGEAQVSVRKRRSRVEEPGDTKTWTYVMAPKQLPWVQFLFS